jgi:hypothetical protein
MGQFILTDSFSSLQHQVKTTLSVLIRYKVCLKHWQITGRFKPSNRNSRWYQIDDRSREKPPKCIRGYKPVGRRDLRRPRKGWYRHEGLCLEVMTMRRRRTDLYQTFTSEYALFMWHDLPTPCKASHFPGFGILLIVSGTMAWLLGPAEGSGPLQNPYVQRTIQPQRNKNICDPNGIRINNPITPTAEDSKRQSGHCDRLSVRTLIIKSV